MFDNIQNSTNKQNKNKPQITMNANKNVLKLELEIILKNSESNLCIVKVKWLKLGTDIEKKITSLLKIYK